MNCSISFFRNAVKKGICCGCGACAALDRSGTTVMKDTPFGPVPVFTENAEFPVWAETACPAHGIHYPHLYKKHYGGEPKSWLFGEICRAYTGFSGDPEIRQRGASGGVLTHILCRLLEKKLVDGVITARQGVDSPLTARAVIAYTEEEILASSQSVYIPVSMLDILPKLEKGKRYALTALPETSAALRVMQENQFEPAKQIRYVLGPYTGTALYPAAITAFLRSRGVRRDDPVTRLQWRAGNWPGYLQIETASGKVLSSPKVYYNYLIPFFVTQNSLQSMDFANEFADAAVGDAWSPKFEEEAKKGSGGQSVVAVRTKEMETIVEEMRSEKLLMLKEIDPLQAGDMHGHMLDFKKRGGYLRNRWRIFTGRPAPDNGYKPADLPFVRILIEIVISSIFALGRTSLCRWTVAHIPEKIIGPVFDFSRKKWKKLSRPTKRKGLKNFKVLICPDETVKTRTESSDQ